MWTLEHPFWLLLLLGLPLLVWLRHFRPKRGGTISFAFSNWRGNQFKAPVTWQTLLNGALTMGFWLGTVCLVIALAGPATVSRERIFLSQGINIMVVLDCSPSMAAQDFGSINRIDHAKETIRNFLSSRENDSIGLVAFAAEASLRVPPSLDLNAFLAALDGVKIMEEGDGTAIGLGLSLANLHLKDAGPGRKVIILLTDGENNAGEISPEVAAGISQSLGIRVYAIGLGGNGDVPLEYVDPNTGKLFRGTYRGTIGEPLLKNIAALTGGQYFSAASPGTLEAVFQTIDSLEKVENRVRIEIHTNSWGDFFIMLAMCLLMADAVLRRLVLKELA